jgi:uncharacterized LabA/DUF88 family protein
MRSNATTGRLLTTVFVDYDNIYLSLKRKSEDAAKLFAKNAQQWLKEIESGRLITSTNGPAADLPRRMVMNRCYGNPVPRRNSSDNSTDMNSFPFVRHNFLRAGFEVIDCPPLTAQLKNSSDIRMVMDVRDLLNHDTYFDEFIILSGDADFTPVLQRLRAHARRTVIFANDYTATPYTAISDGEIRESDLIALLVEGRLPGDVPAQIEAPAPMAALPSAKELEAIRKEILAEVSSVVLATTHPVPLEALADRAIRTLGHERTVGSAWGGVGSFRDLVQRSLPPSLKLSDQPPYFVYSTVRRAPAEAVAPAAPGRAESLRSEHGRQPAPFAMEPMAPSQQVPVAPAQQTAATYREPQRMLPGNPPTAHPAAPEHGLLGVAKRIGGGMMTGSPVPPQQAPAQPLASAGEAVAQPRPPARNALAERMAGEPAPAAPQQPQPQPQMLNAAPPIPRAPASQSTAPAPRASDGASAIQQSVARIHEACQAPPLSPPEYRALFDVMAQEITANGLTGSQTLANIMHRAHELGVEVRRDDVRFVLDVVSEQDPWFEQGATSNLFANRFRNFVIARCRGQGLTLSADELDLIDAWFAVGATSQRSAGSGQSQRPAAPQAAPAAAPQANTAGERWWNLDEGRQATTDNRFGTADGSGDDYPRILRTRRG